MIVRHYSESDLEQVKALHAKQGLAYELPDLEAPGMLVRVVVEENGLIQHAAFLRKTAETYWLFDPDEPKRDRLGKLLALHKEMNGAAKRVGLEDAHCWIPPEVAADKLTDRTMQTLGWERPLWVSYCRKVI